MSQGQHAGGFDIEASHSFSLRNYNKEKLSHPYLESMRGAEGDGGKESALSNYSKMQAESQN